VDSCKSRSYKSPVRALQIRAVTSIPKSSRQTFLRVLGRVCFSDTRPTMEFVPEMGGWVSKHSIRALQDNWQPRPKELLTTDLSHNPNCYPPHVEKWRAHALRETSQNLSFSNMQGTSGTGGPDGWSPVSADGILFTGGKSVSQAVPDSYARAEAVRQARLAELNNPPDRQVALGSDVTLKGGWPIDYSYKRESPRSHHLLGPLKSGK
jgi:hypothetical protein